jgi:1,4-dihydroxy-6-naphthoate synthase
LLTDKFDLLDAGSALGTNCGPLLIARQPIADAALLEGPIAIPGKMTTANFLLSLAYPDAQNKPEYLFSDIEDAVEQGDVVAGLIIHENRFTYQNRGLVKLLDLGEFWETKTGMPIPLGGIVVRKDLPLDLKQAVNRVLRRSVAYARANPESVMPYVRRHAQAMQDAVMQAHIDLYVTDYTADLGAKGRETVRQMFQLALERQIIPNYNKNFFIN